MMSYLCNHYTLFDSIIVGQAFWNLAELNYGSSVHIHSNFEAVSFISDPLKENEAFP